ncbi:MAG: sugar phosphate isomerase/epimerase family protein [Nitriliruptorales bacterium]
MRWYCSSMLLRGRGVAAAVDVAAAAGFDGVEAWVDQAVAHEEDPADLARTAQLAGVGLTTHASSYDINLSATNPGIRAESQRQVLASVRFAADAGSSLVVVHPGRRSSSRDDPEEVWPHVLASLEPVDDLAAELGITLAVELMERRPKEVVMAPADGERVMAHGFRATALTVDIAHLYTLGDPVAGIRRVDWDHVAHIHLSDSDAATVHLPLAKGAMDLPAVHRELLATGYDDIVNIEGYAPGMGAELIENNFAVISRLESLERSEGG